MRYSESHKQQTRAKVLKAAAGAVRGERLARPVNVAVGTTLLLLGLLGLFTAGTTVNVLALNGGPNLLHFAASSALLATGLGSARPGALPRGH